MNTGKVLSVAQAERIAKEIAPTRTISILEDGRVVVRRPSDEEIEKLARHGFDDGVWQAEKPTKAEKTLDQRYEEALQWVSLEAPLSLEFVLELKEGGFDIARLGYDHV